MGKNNQSSDPWKLVQPLLEIPSPWVTVIAEQLQDNQGRILEYWRVKKADSVVILTIQNQRLLLPKPMYRPGVGKITLDFPGGRVAAEQTPLETVPIIVEKELGIKPCDIDKITPLNYQGWEINSSFSNQKLYGFVAEILPNILVDQDYLGATYPTTILGIEDLLKDLVCLQCRGILLEWKHQFKIGDYHYDQSQQPDRVPGL
ncbi:MAG: NUDIX hydrolase [Planktothrix sp.]